MSSNAAVSDSVVFRSNNDKCHPMLWLMTMSHQKQECQISSNAAVNDNVVFRSCNDIVIKIFIMLKQLYWHISAVVFKDGSNCRSYIMNKF